MTDIQPLYFVQHPDDSYSIAKPQPQLYAPEPRTYINVALLEALCVEWESEVRRVSYTEAKPLLEELRELIAKAKDGTL